MKHRVLILGAGFGGLELASTLSDELGDGVDVTLIDQNDAFVFGFAKLDVMFGRTTPEAVRLPYRQIAKAGVRFVQETVTVIDPEALRVTTDAGVYEGGNEFYSVAGATVLRDVLSAFSGGRVVIGVCGAPFKCPPAPSECALLLHDHLVARGIRDARREARDPVRESGAAVARHIARARRGLRRAEHRFRAGPPRQLDRPGAQGRRAR